MRSEPQVSRRRGISPAELAERAIPAGITLDTDTLRDWLLEHGLATEHEGLLAATARGLTIGGGIG